jgi:hypothetical protein
MCTYEHHSDKYVSRAEYDELKARVEHLETLLLSRPQLPSGFTPQPQQGPEPTPSSQAQSKSVGLPSTRLAAAAPGQQQGRGTISTAPVPVPMPIVPYNPIGLPLPPNFSPVGRTSSTATATTTTTPTTLPSIASLANGPPIHQMGVARLHREHRDHEHREQQHQPYAPLPPPQSPLQHQQSLQLQQLRMQRMHQDEQQQTKNCHAQTFTPLGERLRCHHRIFLQGPAAVYRLHRLPNNNSNDSSIHHRHRRILMCGARRGRRTQVPTYRGHPHPERQRSGVRCARRSEKGSSSHLSIALGEAQSRARLVTFFFTDLIFLLLLSNVSLLRKRTYRMLHKLISRSTLMTRYFCFLFFFFGYPIRYSLVPLAAAIQFTLVGFSIGFLSCTQSVFVC